MSVRKTKRQRIFDAVAARLRTISVANGFQTDAGAQVDDWPVRYDEEDLAALPAKVALGVYDLPDEVSKESKHSKGSTHRLRVQVRVHKGAAVSAAELRAVVGDVVDALGRDVTQPALDPLLWPEAANGGKYLAMDTAPAQEGLIVPTEALEVSGAAVECVIEYATALFDPYQ